MNNSTQRANSSGLLLAGEETPLWKQTIDVAVGCYVVFVLIAGTTAFKLFGLGTPAFGLFYLGGLFLIALQLKNLLRSPLSLFFVLLFPLFAVSSSLWGVEPETTLRHAIQLTFTVLVGAAMGSALKPHKLMVAMSVAFVGLILLSVINLWLQVVPAFQQREYLVGNEYFTGIFAHKNTFGMVLCITALCLMYLTLVSRPAWLFAVLVCALLPVFFFARSTTSIVMYAFILCMPAALFFMRSRTWRLPVFFVFLCVLIVSSIGLELWSVSLIDIGLELAGKGRDLSGRTLLWTAATEQVLARPWLGVGYQSFWTAPQFAGEVDKIRGFIEPSIGHFHNAWLEAIVGTGILGLCAFIAVPALLLCRFVSRIVKPECSAFDLAGLFFVCLVLVRANVEASIYFQHHVENLILVALVFATSTRATSVTQSGSVAHQKIATGKVSAALDARYI